MTDGLYFRVWFFCNHLFIKGHNFNSVYVLYVCMSVLWMCVQALTRPEIFNLTDLELQACVGCPEWLLT